MLALFQSEFRSEVILEVFGLLDCSKDLLVDKLLIFLSGGEWKSSSFLFLLLLEESGFVFDNTSLSLLPEIFVFKLFTKIQLAEINFGGCGDNKSLVNAANRNTVQLVWSSYKKETTGMELFKEDDSSAFELAGENDQNSAGGDGLTKFGWANAEVTVKLSAGLFLGVIFGSF